MASTPEQARLFLEGLLERLMAIDADAAPVMTFLQVPASDLNALSTPASDVLLLVPFSAYNLDIILRLLQAGVQPYSTEDVYSNLLRNDVLFDLNGDEYDDAAIARKLRRMYDVHGQRVPACGHISESTLYCCDTRDRLECLRVMVEIDPQARGYTQHAHDSLLHLAARYSVVPIVHFLLQSGWSVDSHDLNRDGRSPLGECQIDYPSPLELEEAIMTATALLQDVQDASAVVRNSGLCDDAAHPGWPRYSSVPSLLRVHVFLCTAVRSYSSLPRHVLNAANIASSAIEHSPTELRTLPLDEHVHTGIGDPIYLRDCLRVASSFDSATRYAATVDALFIVEAIVRSNSKHWYLHTCMRVLHKSGEPAVTGSSPTLRCWAWMRRLHAVSARERVLQRWMAP